MKKVFNIGAKEQATKEVINPGNLPTNLTSEKTLENLLAYFKQVKCGNCPKDYNTCLDDNRDYIEELVQNKGINLFCEENLFFDIMVKLIERQEGSNKEENKFRNRMIVAERLYKLVASDPGNGSMRATFTDYLDFYIDNYLSRDEFEKFIEPMYPVFEKKSLPLSIYRQIQNFDKSVNKTKIVNFIIKARQYYVDELAAYSAATDLISTVKDESKTGITTDEVKELIHVALGRARNVAGIYDFSEQELIDIAHRLESVQGDVADLRSRASTDIGAMVDRAEAAFKEQLRKQDKLGQVTLDAARQSQRRIEEASTEAVKEINSLVGTKKLKGKVVQVRNQAKANKLLDKNTPLSDRYKALDKLKMSDEHYHESFDNLAYSALAKKPTILSGDNGVGKSTAVDQLGATLGLPIYRVGQVDDYHLAFKGFMAADNSFVASPLYHAYMNGGILCFDNFDKSDPRVMNELNTIIGKDGYRPYTFADGTIVEPSPNLVVVCTTDKHNLEVNDALIQAKLNPNDFAVVNFEEDLNLAKNILADHPDLLKVWNKLDLKNEFGVAVADALVKNVGSGNFSLVDYFELNPHLSSYLDQLTSEGYARKLTYPSSHDYYDAGEHEIVN